MKKEGRISIGWRTESNRGLPTKLGKDVNLIESWLMLADECDTHTRSPLIVPSVSIVLSATISLEYFLSNVHVFLNFES